MSISKNETQGEQLRFLGDWLFLLYGPVRGSMRKVIINFVLRFERGDSFSSTLRKILRTYHKVEVGLYSSGGCLIPGNLGTNTKVGRYCSISPTARAFNANHPMNLCSSHAFFFNPALGIVEDEKIERTRLIIGHDVAIGDNAVITASVQKIGTGSVIGHNSVVSQDVPPYAIIEGHPGRIIGYRFPEKKIASLLAAEWWNLPPEEVLECFSLQQTES